MFLSLGMYDGQDFLLDFEYDTQGEALLDQSADHQEEPMEKEEVIILDEVEFQPPEPTKPAEPADSGSLLGCQCSNPGGS